MKAAEIRDSYAFVWGFGSNKEDELGVKQYGKQTANKVDKVEQMPAQITFSSGAAKKLRVVSISTAENHSGLVTECGQVFMCGSFMHGKLGFE